MKLIPLALVLALLAAACGGTTPDLPAVAASSAQEAQAQIPEEEDQSPFCQAIDKISPYPFTTLPLDDTALASRIVTEADPEAIAAASTSFRSVAAVVPADAPNIIHYYFEVTPDVVAGLGQNDGDNNIELVRDVIVAGSVRGEQVEEFVTRRCSDSTLAAQPLAPTFVLPPDPLVTPSRLNFCAALADFESAYAAMTSSSGTDIPDTLLKPAQAAAQEVTSLLDPDAGRFTTAYLRLTAYALGVTDTAESMEVGLILLFALPGDVIDADLQALCPEATDPGGWVIAAQTPRITSPGASVTRRLPTAIPTFTADSVAVTISAAIHERNHVDGTGRDADELRLVFTLSFDKAHDFSPVDFVVTAPDGTEFPADPEQTIPLDGGEVTFPVDRDVDFLDFWTLEVRGTSIDL